LKNLSQTKPLPLNEGAYVLSISST
jgi:hypothetical protein